LDERKETAKQRDVAYAFPDTNVLIHGKALRSIPWRRLLRSDRVVLVIAETVYSELDKKTHDPDRATARRARSRAKSLHSVLDRPGQVAAEVDAVYTGRAKKATFDEHGLDTNYGDDRLLATALEWGEREDVSYCCLVTIDYGFATRVRDRPIECVLLDSLHRQPLKVDDRVQTLERQLKELMSDRRLAKLRLMPPDSKPVISVDRPPSVAATREQLEIEMEAVRKEHPRVSALPAFMAQSAMATLYGGPSDPEAYNKKLEEVYLKYRQFLDLREERRFLETCCQPVDVLVGNEGTGSATSITVFMTIRANGVTFTDPENWGREPEPPGFPPKSGRLSALVGSSYLSPTYSNRHGALVNPPRATYRLLVTGSTTARYELDNLVHGMAREFTITFLVDPDEAKSGSLEYEIHAEGQPTASRGHVDIVVR